jgi:hypothetical protein
VDWYRLITSNPVKKHEKSNCWKLRREKIAGKVDWYRLITSHPVKKNRKKLLETDCKLITP